MKDKLVKIIGESRELIRYATPEQKVKLLKLIKESLHKIKQQPVIESVSAKTKDYIEEK